MDTTTTPRSTHAAIARLTASHCCVCRAELTDAESVEHGIGPVCSKRYYSPLHKPNASQIKNALGLLACGDFPEHIEEGFTKLVNTKDGEPHANARVACNLLVYWASCHYDERDEVFKCSAIIRTLGYIELADKLEADRTVAIVREHDDHLEVFIPAKYRFTSDMKDIPGTETLLDHETGPTGQPVEKPRKVGRKVGWKVPIKEKDYFLTVLGFHCGGELACGDGKVWKVPRKTWYDLRPFKTPAKATTSTAPSNGAIRLEATSNGHFRVFTPYNTDFIVDLKKINYKHRRWNPKDRCWEVEKKFETEVKGLITKHYGVTL